MEVHKYKYLINADNNLQEYLNKLKEKRVKYRMKGIEFKLYSDEKNLVNLIVNKLDSY
jgi:hypothetical protein